jgi:KaiC/GvpD/RAD55 family RecA-like ATPase
MNSYNVEIDKKIFSVKINESDDNTVNEVKEIISICTDENKVVCLKAIEEYFNYKKEYLSYSEKKKSFLYRNEKILLIFSLIMIMVGVIFAFK